MKDEDKVIWVAVDIANEYCGGPYDLAEAKESAEDLVEEGFDVSDVFIAKVQFTLERGGVTFKEANP